MLAELLGVNEPWFHMHLRQLERTAGRPCADIRLAVRIATEAKDKIQQLGLDPYDTTGDELFAALEARLIRDEALVRRALKITSSDKAPTIMAAVTSHAAQKGTNTKVFVAKQTAVRAILKKMKPKATMKGLGYRSMDSMFKHEPVALLLAASYILESPEWHTQRIAHYAKLKPSDFEIRSIIYVTPKGKRWPQLSQQFVAQHKHTIVTFPELGAIVVLPIEQDMPGLAVTSMVLCMNALNDVRSVSAYIKLQQVKANFGTVVTAALTHQLVVDGIVANHSLQWQYIHHFYGVHTHLFPAEVFEPHVHTEDLQWDAAEDTLAELHCALEFWQGNHLLGVLDYNHTAISMNVLDVALGVCNNVAYAGRFVHALRTALDYELHAGYLQHEPVQLKLADTLQRATGSAL
jgi:hypothetical protein